MTKFLIFSICFFLCAPLAHATKTALPAPVANALKQANIPATAVSVCVHAVNKPHPSLAHNADSSMNPASVMKLVTAYAALDLLGPAYTWTTEIYTDGKIENEMLDGNLILKGYGDPKLNHENFWKLLRRLRQMGVRDIKGDLVLDGSHFSPAISDPAAFDRKPHRAYNVSPEALLVNHKIVALQFVPQAETGSVRVLVDPVPETLKLTNNLKLTDGKCGEWRDALQADIVATNGAFNNSDNGGKKSADHSASVTLNGSYAAACGEKSLLLSLHDNTAYTDTLFRNLWREQGGALHGKTRSGKLPEAARLLFRHESPPLGEIVRDINKYSNNIMARQVFLTLGAAPPTPVLSPASGRELERGKAEEHRRKNVDQPPIDSLPLSLALSPPGRGDTSVLSPPDVALSDVPSKHWLSGKEPPQATAYPANAVRCTAFVGCRHERDREAVASGRALERGQSNTPATEALASTAVKNWLSTKKLNFPELVLENGSGLSRIERISARHLGLLLNDAFRSAVMPEFIASLPIAAADGTMKKRLADTPAARQAHIKTGYLEGVKTLGGYVRDKNGERHSVVFFISHPNAANGDAAMDALLEWVYNSQ